MDPLGNDFSPQMFCFFLPVDESYDFETLDGQTDLASQSVSSQSPSREKKTKKRRIVPGLSYQATHPPWSRLNVSLLIFRKQRITVT